MGVGKNRDSVSRRRFFDALGPDRGALSTHTVAAKSARSKSNSARFSHSRAPGQTTAHRLAVLGHPIPNPRIRGTDPNNSTVPPVDHNTLEYSATNALARATNTHLRLLTHCAYGHRNIEDPTEGIRKTFVLPTACAFASCAEAMAARIRPGGLIR